MPSALLTAALKADLAAQRLTPEMREKSAALQAALSTTTSPLERRRLLRGIHDLNEAAGVLRYGSVAPGDHASAEPPPSSSLPD